MEYLTTMSSPKMLELFMPLLLTWKTIWSTWMVVSLMSKILSIIQKSIAQHFMKRYHWCPSIACQLIDNVYRYFPTRPVLSMASTGHPGLLDFSLLNSVRSYKLRNWTHPLQEHPIFLSVFWPSVIFQLILMYELFFVTCCHLTCAQGSIEFLSRYTSIDSPFALYDAHTGESYSNTYVSHTLKLYHDPFMYVVFLQHVWSWNSHLVHRQHAGTASPRIYRPFWCQTASTHQ